MACIDNIAYIEAASKQATAITRQALADTAMQIALALWQRNSSASIVNMQTEIADRNVKMAEAVHSHAKKFWPAERAIVDDAFNEGKAQPQYDGTALAWGAIVDSSLRAGREDWLQTMREWCLPPSRCEDSRWRRNAELARADMLSFADRQEEARAEILNDRRYARQYAALGIGKGRLDIVRSFSDLSGTVGLQAGRALIGTINTGLEALGYSGSRIPARGWAARIQENWARAPAPATVQAPQVFVQTQPIEPIRNIPTEPLDPCGPMPSVGASDAEWARWDKCKGHK